MAQTVQRQRSTTFICYLVYHQVESEQIGIKTLTKRSTSKFKIRLFKYACHKKIFKQNHPDGRNYSSKIFEFLYNRMRTKIESDRKVINFDETRKKIKDLMIITF